MAFPLFRVCDTINNIYKLSHFIFHMDRIPPAEIRETQASREIIRKALTVWAEIFPRQAPVTDDLIDEMEDGGYVVGNFYPVNSKIEDPHLSGVRLAYDETEYCMWLYANDYKGDPAPLLIQLANELREKGVNIAYIRRQSAYNPPNPEETVRVMDEYNRQNRS